MGFGKKLGRGLAMAMMGVGNEFTKRADEKRKFDMAKELAAAKGGGAQSSLGKLAFDLFGRMPQTPDEWKQVTELKKSAGWGPQGAVNVTIPGMDILMSNLMKSLNQDFATDQNMTPANLGNMQFDFDNPIMSKTGKVKLYPAQ